MFKKRAVRYTLILAFAGIAIALMVLYVNQYVRNSAVKNIPYVRLVDQSKSQIAQAYLLFEQAINDENADLNQQAVSLLTNSHDLLQGAYEGKQTELGAFTLSDEEIKVLLKETSIGVENFTMAIQEHWKFKKEYTNQESELPVEGDSTVSDSTVVVVEQAINPEIELSMQVDSTYAHAQGTLQTFSDYINKRVEADSGFSSFLSSSLVVLILGVVALLSFSSYRYVRKNEKSTAEATEKLNKETRRVETLSGFIESVSTGNYAIDIDATDDLSNKLISMRDTLRNNAEEDQRRNWATSGLARIGEILRASENTGELYDSIIQFVVKYSKSNQGGLFLINEDNERDPYLEMVSCYAFERKKFIQKRVDFGQGLVGQCYLEGERIHLLEIPEEYVSITSGLGGTNPNALLVVPMKVNDKVYGVIELASFKKYEEHEIALIEKFAESIGAAVSSVKINESTRLLLEKTQQQAEEMRSQEEEMRQNMEELSATQEEMVRKEREYINRIKELEDRVGRNVASTS